MDADDRGFWTQDATEERPPARYVGVSNAKMDLETKTKTSRPCGQTEMQHHLRGADLLSPRTSPGNLNQLLHFWRHLSSSQGFLTRGWRVASLQEVEHWGNLPKSFFLLAWRDGSTEINTACSSRGQASSPSTHPQDTAVCNSNPRGSHALF